MFLCKYWTKYFNSRNIVFPEFFILWKQNPRFLLTGARKCMIFPDTAPQHCTRYLRLLQYCGSGSAWIRTILGSWIRIRIKVKSRMRIRIRIKVKSGSLWRSFWSIGGSKSGKWWVVGSGSGPNWKIESGSESATMAFGVQATSWFWLRADLNLANLNIEAAGLKFPQIYNIITFL